MTLYSYKDKIYDWSSNLIDKLDLDDKKLNNMLIVKGCPLTCEYRKISIVSDNFDSWSKSETMIVNYVKNSTNSNKDKAMESITYYDDDNSTENIKIKGKKYKKTTIGPFDSSEYGHPVCFHTPGYKGTIINITTKMWEVNENKTLKNLLKSVKNIIGMSELLSGSPYLNIASTAFGISSQILVGLVKHEELCPDHTIELRLDSCNYPLIAGKYICIPDLKDLNYKEHIINNYILKDNLLVMIDEDGLYEEYTGTYFVLKISNYERDDLADFDFTASSADLLGKIHSGSYAINDLTNDILTIERDAHDLNLIKTVQDDYNKYIESLSNNTDESIVNDYKKELTASYNQLAGSSTNSKEWFEFTFPNVKKAIIE